jgi:hypothetical protein
MNVIIPPLAVSLDGQSQMDAESDANLVEQAVQRLADDERLSLVQARFWYGLRVRLTQRGFYSQVEQDRPGQQQRIAEYQARWFPRR